MCSLQENYTSPAGMQAEVGADSGYGSAVSADAPFLRDRNYEEWPPFSTNFDTSIHLLVPEWPDR